MVFKCEPWTPTLKKNLQLIQGNQKIKTPMLYFTYPMYLLFKLNHQINLKRTKKNTHKLEMVFKRENHKLLLQQEFLQVIQRNPKKKTWYKNTRSIHFPKNSSLLTPWIFCQLLKVRKIQQRVCIFRFPWMSSIKLFFH